MTNISVSHLRRNPGQQRTTLDVEKLATLAEQIYARGLDADHPIVVTAIEDGTYRIVRGHRRTMAFCIAELNRADIEALSASGVTVHECLLSFIKGLAAVHTTTYTCAECGREEEKATLDNEGIAYCPACGQHAIEEREEVVYSGQKLAAAFEEVLSAGRNLTIPVVVQSYDSRGDEQLALITDAFGAEDPDILGQAFAFSEALNLGVPALTVAMNTGLKTTEVYGLAALVDMPEPVQKMAAAGRLLISHLGKIAAVISRLQREALYHLLEGVPSITHQRLDGWIKAMKTWTIPTLPLGDVEPKLRNVIRLETTAHERASDKVDYWVAVAMENRALRLRAANMGALEEVVSVLPQLSCANCQLRECLGKLPKNIANSNYPCLRDKNPGTCLGAVPEGDPWLLEASWAADLEGAVKIGNTYFFTSLDDIRTEDGESVTDAMEAEEETSSVLQQQRSAIGTFLQINETLNGADHPLATRCANCGYHLSGSPTKDPDVPHCMWARNRRNIQIDVLQPEDGRNYQIPVCRQYMPIKPWNELIPEAKVDGSFSRAQTDRLIELVAHLLQRERVAPLRQLTGMPIKSDEKVDTWFLERYLANRDSLSDGQMITLAKWMLAEWNGVSQGTQPLELPSGLEINFKPVEIAKLEVA